MAHKITCPTCYTPMTFRELLNHTREGRREARARGYTR